MSKCDGCWVEFPTDEELAKHVQMEEMVDWPIDGLDLDGQAPSTNAETM